MFCAGIIFAERFLWSWHLSEAAETRKQISQKPA